MTTEQRIERKNSWRDSIIPETQITVDYTNEVNAFASELFSFLRIKHQERCLEGLKTIAGMNINENGKIIRKYAEIYGEEAVNDQNRATVEELDRIADEINTAYSNNTLTIGQLANAIESIFKTIGGRRKADKIDFSCLSQDDRNIIISMN